MAARRVTVDVQDGIAVVTISRAEKLNALDGEMIEALADNARAIDRDMSVRSVILTGAGSRAFSAGGDLNAWSSCSPADFGRFWVREGHDAFAALARLRQPLIAALNGDALGGGLELAACADLRVAEAHIRIGQPETSLGIIPGWSGTQRLVRRFGPQAVRRMAVFGEVFGAEDALRLGLVDHVVASGTGVAAARKIASAVIDRAPLATELSKMLINAAEGEEAERVLDAAAGIAAAGSAELQEGLAAFREKRRPRF